MDLKLSDEERMVVARKWIAETGLCVGRGGLEPTEVAQSHVDELLRTLVYKRAGLTYYSLRPVELAGDVDLVYGVCPLFVLHGIAALMANDTFDSPRGVSCSWQLALHCVKTCLKRQARDPVAFLVRLFDLIYQDHVMQPAEPPLPQCNLIVAFLSDGLEFLLEQPNGAPHRFVSHSLLEPDSLAIVVNSNLFRSREKANEAALIASTVGTDLMTRWSHFQRCRGTAQEVDAWPTTIPINL